MKTPLFERHAASGARMVDFCGWEMPLFFSGIVDEYKAVRRAAGIFDLCHMVKFRVSGEEAGKKLSENTTRDVFAMNPGSAWYMLVLSASGGIVDDILVYRAENYFLVVANAGNRESVSGLLEGAKDETFSTGMLAVQGPEAATVTEKLLGKGPSSLKNFKFGKFAFEGEELIVSRTGYTGGDGFEYICPAGAAGRLWDAVLSAGADRGVKPAGLGARDLLRIEAGMPLYGHELSLSVNPFEAGLGKFVSFGKSFTGRDALLKLKDREPGIVLKGVEAEGRAVPRQGCPLYSGDRRAGGVTSGSYSPLLEKPVALAYIEKGFSEPGTLLEAVIRGARHPVRVVKPPFYRKEKGNVSS